ncbi:MAG: hypothetical protein AB1324_06550 [Candidatus Micrarchaeota archaeon]
MADDLEPQKKLEIYKLVLSRYRDLISEKETRSVSEIRQRVSPYTDWVRAMRERMLSDIAPYDRRRHFQAAAERAMEYVRGIRTCEFAFTFWMDFGEMDSLRIGTAMDKAILLAALIRALESEDVRVLVTKAGRPYVRFTDGAVSFLFVPESGSLLMGEDAMKTFANDPVAYSFSDLAYENYEDQ